MTTVIGLPAPGGVPVPGGISDDDLADSPRKNEHRSASPAKRRRGRALERDQAREDKDPDGDGQIQVGVSTLQMMLAQQSANLLEAQSANLTRALGELEAKQNKRIEGLETKIDQGVAQTQTLQGELRQALERIKALEDRPGGLGKGDGSSGRRTSLVFGGWCDGTRKHVILHQLQESLKYLAVDHLLDSDPFCTGPRRAVALSNFVVRGGENQGDLRKRMLDIVQEVNRAKLTLQGGKRPLWASISKTPEERGRAALAGVTKKLVMNHRPGLVSELDLDYAQGAAWIGEYPVAGMGVPPEGTKATEIETRGGQAWLDEGTIAKQLKLSLQTVEDEVKGHRWNVGGGDLDDLPRVVAEATHCDLQMDDLVLLQELPREPVGWKSKDFGPWKMIAHRDASQWRGNGIVYHSDAWKVLRKIKTEKGVWIRLQHCRKGSQLWAGSIYLKPELTQDQHAVALQDFLRALPATQLPVVLSGDSNSAIAWSEDQEGSHTAVGKNGKTLGLLHSLASRSLQVVAPVEPQLECPTTCPRQADRAGRQIDFLAVTRCLSSRVSILTGSHDVLGTDHDMLVVLVTMKGGRVPRKTDTRPRVLTRSLPKIEKLDQTVISNLAQSHTAPKTGTSYSDPEDVKALFRIARFGRNRDEWKAAFQARRKARGAWQQEQLRKAAAGDWGAFRRVRKKPKGEWEHVFADANSDPHRCIHDHLQNIYRSDECVEVCEPVLPFQPVQLEELQTAVRLGKRGVSVCHDGTSQELIQGIMVAEGGAEALRQWFSEILRTGNLPEDWYRSLMVVLPKTSHPVLPKELRPISMSSALSKTFCRIVLQRSKKSVKAQGSCQCSGPQKQTTDYIYCVHHLMALEREWKGGLAFLKVDLEKAFDLVSRPALSAFLRERLGDSYELRIWQQLLASRVGLESPLFFACLAEMTVEKTAERFHWTREDPALPGLHLSEALFVDDSILWNSSVSDLGLRTEQWAQTLAECGLRINIEKCALYVSPFHRGGRSITVQGVTLESGEHLNVMGLQLSVTGTTCRMLAGLLARARDTFWSMKNLLLSDAPIHARIRLMHKVVGGCGLWCISAFFPEQSAQHLVNTFQMQLIISMLKIKRGNIAGGAVYGVRDTGCTWAISPGLCFMTRPPLLDWSVDPGDFMLKIERSGQTFMLCLGPMCRHGLATVMVALALYGILAHPPEGHGHDQPLSHGDVQNTRNDTSFGNLEKQDNDRKQDGHLTAPLCELPEHLDEPGGSAATGSVDQGSGERPSAEGLPTSSEADDPTGMPTSGPLPSCPCSSSASSSTAIHYQIEETPAITAARLQRAKRKRILMRTLVTDETDYFVREVDDKLDRIGQEHGSDGVIAVSMELRLDSTATVEAKGNGCGPDLGASTCKCLALKRGGGINGGRAFVQDVSVYQEGDLDAVLEHSERDELSFLKSLGIMPPPPRNRIRRSGKDGEAYATEDANYLVQLPKDFLANSQVAASELIMGSDVVGGAKTIGFLGSVAVLVNNLLGPGIANFSGMYQQSGWLVPTSLVVVCVLSSLASSAMLLASIRAYPGNKDYDVRVEYGTLCRHYLPRSVAVIFQGLFQLAMLSANVSNIIQTAQVCDYLFVDIAGASCAIEVFPDFEVLCRASRSDITPFGAGKLLISAGMVTVAVLSIPLGYWNLEDNVRAQNAALLVILLSISLWVGIFCALGLEEERVPTFGSSFHNMGGTVLFNFMFVSTLPSWVCEKKPHVRPMRTITAVLMVATVGYILVGLLGGVAFEPFFNSSNTLLSELQHISPEAPRTLRIVAKSTIQAYSISANLASIPIFCILMRYNLQEGMGMSRYWASAIAILVPFVLAIAFYCGQGFHTAVNLSGTFVSALVNLIAPSLFFLCALRQTRAAPEETKSTSLRPSWSTNAFDCLQSGPSEPKTIWRCIAWTNLIAMLLLTFEAMIN
ncbi:unnamed protein product [Symbiodinium sp. CCMP2592]|nr:unnamed protein product [Symbiodinium sp. CCMP2592]